MKNLVVTVAICILTMLLIASFLGLCVATQLHSAHAVSGEYAQVNYTYFYTMFVMLSAFISSLIISVRHYN